MSDVRPFEEYKEMIKDMRKEEMIKGLYDLSARITEQDKEIDKLQEDNKELGRLYSRANNEFLRLHSIIKEVREYIYRNSFDEERKEIIDDLWINEINDFLEILDKENE